MNKAQVVMLAQLLSAMKEAAAKLEMYSKEKNVEKFEAVKKELMALQRKIDELI